MGRADGPQMICATDSTSIGSLENPMESMDTALFPYDNAGSGVGGALMQDPKNTPRAEGTLIYLNCEGHLEEVIDRVAPAGGAVVLPKTDIGAPGFISIIQDTEGNRVGLHSCTAR